MLENCAGLEDCERVLAGQVEKVAFLGQVELSSEDVEKLGALIGERIKNDIRRGTQYLQQRAETCLVQYLVDTGIWKYKDGSYWPALAEAVGLDDVNWQVRWGSFFLQYLTRKGLQQFDLEQDEEGAWRYVTPILLHGGIPDCCLDEFFSRIVVRLIDDDRVAEDDVRDWLYSVREQEFRKRDLYKEIRELEKEKEKLSVDYGRLSRLENLVTKVGELAAAASSPGQWSELPEDCPGFLREKESELKDVQRQITDLERRREACCRRIRQFTQEDRIILELGSTVEQYAQEYQDFLKEREKLRELEAEEKACREKLNALAASFWGSPWEDGYGDLLENISWDLLAVKCEEYRALREAYRPPDEGRSQKNAEARRLPFVGCWPGIISTAAGVGLLFSPLRWAGALFLSAGVLMAAGAFIRWRREKRLEKEQREALQCRMSAAEKEMRRLEGEINRIVAGLPFPADCSWIQVPDAIDRLGSLREAFERRQDCLCQMRQVESRLAGWRQRAAEAAAAAVGALPDFGGCSIEVMLEKLSRSRQKRETAEQAERALREEIAPRLQELRDCEARIERDLCRVKARLLYLGRGSLEEGINELAVKRDVFRQVKVVIAEIEELLGLLNLPWEALPDGRIGELCRAKGAELESLCSRLKEKEKEMAGHPSSLPDLDRPIERFLLYGGEWTERWLIGAVRLAERAFRERNIPHEVEPDLPARVVDGFREWWRENHPSDPNGNTDLKPERFANPVLKLDQRQRGLVIFTDRCRFRLEDARLAPTVILKITACGQVAGDDSLQPVELPLRVYRGKEGWAETEVVEYSVPPAKEYEVALVVNGKVRRSLRIEGIKDGRPFLVFDENGKQFAGEVLPRRRFWLLLLSGYRLPFNVPVIEDATPPWQPGYCLFLVDLSDAQEFYLTDGSGVRCGYPLAEGESFEPYLSGGQTVDFVSVEGAPVYAGEPPFLVIPVDNETGWKGWSIVVRYGRGLSAERRRCLLGELPEESIRRCDGRMEVPLALPELLGPGAAGDFTVRLRASKKSEYVFRLTVVPDLLVFFEPQLLLPFSQEGEQTNVTVIIPENAALEVEQPAAIISVEDDAYEIEVPREEDVVRVTLVLDQTSQTAEEKILPMDIRVPAVRWRLLGLKGGQFREWQKRVAEVWLGDWEEAGDALYLELGFPAEEGETVQFCLDGSTHYVTGQIRNGCTRFNLLEFTDTLRSGGEPLRSFSIKVYGSRRKPICEGLLFRVLCRWIVEDVKWTVRDLGGRRQLRVEWRERGRAQNRVLRVWRLWEPWSPLLVEPIPDGAVQITVEREKAVLPPGRYLLQFAVEDPWRADEPVSFPTEGLNTVEIDISGGEPYIKDLDIRLQPEEALISGVLVNAAPGEKLIGSLCGIAGRRGEVRRTETAVAADGAFRFEFARSEGGPLPLPVEAHWLVLATEGLSFYEFSILENPAPLKFALEELTVQEVAELIEVQEGVDVRIESREGDLTCFELPAEAGSELIGAWTDGRSEVDVDLIVNQRFERVKIKRTPEETQLLLERGVKCIGCGMILPNTQAWYQHSAGLEEHPGLIINYVNVPISLYLIWDVAPLIRRYRAENYAGWRELLVLYSSRHMPLPGRIIDEGRLDCERLFGVLWEREKERARALARGLRKVER
ncbi:hypothetical protein Tph_c02520 [Thermacetogenium phaeum DSM 12270]|uniref:Uncharacterized protein n=1 Tax=Thermacetogenium phaeum (strain ATCC BAA-254 / DSM 26808 / PB) TaxID=1089553 RepID=K4LQX0_THEPS|nr:hypothetical protein [Thermacetogenium phaeum]AFV10499.1 hypothetical protein Tph_c02520 [Thermacetogenium phaeum DSM 12270]